MNFALEEPVLEMALLKRESTLNEAEEVEKKKQKKRKREKKIDDEKIIRISFLIISPRFL